MWICSHRNPKKCQNLPSLNEVVQGEKANVLCVLVSKAGNFQGECHETSRKKNFAWKIWNEGREDTLVTK